MAIKGPVFGLEANLPKPGVPIWELCSIARMIFSMADLYPPIEPFSSEWLDVGEGHRLYLEQCGNPDGIAVVFLHGGPGGGISAGNRRFFDPQRYRIVLFDQRGAGRSTPHADIDNNDTDRLIHDIERIRTHLGIERWVVFGGSWGSTLGLLYAQAFPDRCLALILRGIFLNRDQDFEWLYGHGTRRVFPDYWDDLLAMIPESEQNDPVGAYYRRINADDEELAHQAAKEWARFEGRCATLRPNPELVESFLEPDQAWHFSRICTHFFVNRLFMESDRILEQADRLAGIPGVIVHGRYDMICAPDQAWALHHAWPDSELRWVDDAGHSATEPGIGRELVAATDRIASRFVTAAG